MELSSSCLLGQNQVQVKKKKGLCVGCVQIAIIIKNKKPKKKTLILHLQKFLELRLSRLLHSKNVLCLKMFISIPLTDRTN